MRRSRLLELLPAAREIASATVYPLYSFSRHSSPFILLESFISFCGRIGFRMVAFFAIFVATSFAGDAPKLRDTGAGMHTTETEQGCPCLSLKAAH